MNLNQESGKWIKPFHEVGGAVEDVGADEAGVNGVGLDAVGSPTSWQLLGEYDVGQFGVGIGLNQGKMIDKILGSNVFCTVSNSLSLVFLWFVNKQLCHCRYSSIQQEPLIYIIRLFELKLKSYCFPKFYFRKYLLLANFDT